MRRRKLELTKAHDEFLTAAGEAMLPVKVIAARDAKHREAIAEIDAALFEYEKTAVFAFVIDDMVRDGPAALWNRWDALPVDRQRRVVSALFTEVKVLRAPQGSRFSGKFVRPAPTGLYFKLLDLAQ